MTDKPNFSPESSRQAQRPRGDSFAQGGNSPNQTRGDAISSEEMQRTIHDLQEQQLELKKQNKELQRKVTELDGSRARYFDFGDLAPVGYCTIDEGGIILQANLTTAALLGVSRESLAQQPIARFILKPDQEVLDRLRKTLLQIDSAGAKSIGSETRALEGNIGQEKQSCELRLVKSDRTTVWVHVTASVGMATSATTDSTVGNTAVLRLVLSEITERKKAEAELRRITERFELAIAGSTDGLWDWDLTTNTVFYSARYKELLGYTPDDARFPHVYDSFKQHLHPNDLVATERAFQHSVLEGQPYHAVYRLRTATGDWRWFEARGATLKDDNNLVIRMAGSISDITEQKRSEEALRNERFLMQALMQHVPDYIYFKDCSSRLIRISHSHAQALGMSDPAQAVGKTDFDFFTDEHARQAYQDEQTIILTGQPLIKEEKETWTNRPDTWASTIKVPLRDVAGNIIGTFGISRDITARKQMEEALAQERFLMQALMKNVPDFVYFKDRDGRLIRISQSKAKAHGLPDPALALGKTDFDFFAPDHAREALADEQTVIETGLPITKVERLQWPDRADTWVSTTKVPLRDDGENIIGTFGISRDITAQKLAAESLRQSELALTEAQRLAHIGSFHWNALRDELVWSDELYTIFEQDRNSPLPNYEEHLRIYTPESAKKLTATVKQALTTGTSYEIDLEQVSKNGLRRWVVARGEAIRDATGLITGLRGTVQQITERKQAEEKLRLSDLVLKNVSKGVLITGPDRRIISANNAFTALTGYSEAEILGRDCVFLQGPLSDPTTVNAMLLALLNGQEFTGTILNYRKDGTVFWNDLSISSVRDEDEITTHFIGIIRDITERKEAEFALIKAKAEAETANRAKSEFLATMSHEIRTPMNGVIGFTDLLLDTTLDQQQRRFVEMLKSSSQTLLTVINDILDYSKIESGNIALETVECDAGKLVEDQTALLEPQARSRNLAVHVNFESTASRLVLADPGRFRQVLGNLLGNALKFIQKGSITVTLAPVQINDAPHLRISVVDTGIGIHPDQHERLFKRFSQANNSTTRLYGGTGLGLAISKRLVELMGGQIGFQSEYGRGSTFWFTVPQPPSAIVPDPTAAPNSTASVSATDQPLRALIVEDNFINQELAKYHLMKLGCKVTVASGGAVALELVLKHQFDLIFMDCMMPEMDGYQTTRALREWERSNPTQPRHPIIALTANAMPGDRELCLDSGMDDYLSKPIISDQLAAVIERWRPAKNTAMASRPIEVGSGSAI